MFRTNSPVERSGSAYRGSSMLASGSRRLARITPAVLFLWALAGWAMDWW